MKRKICFIIVLLNILLIFNLKSYAIELGNELTTEDSNIGNNTNTQEPENNTEITPPVEEPQDPVEPSEPIVPDEPEEPEMPEDPEDPEEPEQSLPEEPENPIIPSEPEKPIEPEEPVTPPQVDENTGSNDDYVEDTYNPVEESSKSSNNNLQRLEVTGMEIEPEFDKEITEYYLIVDLTVEELEIIAIAEDYNARVDVQNNTELVEGENTVKIIVTAEDGTQKVYTIFVTKTDDVSAANADLKKLKVKGFDIYPTFKNKIYKYNLTINEKITSLNIEAEPENENATVEIKGNSNLEEGNNIITIVVTAEDGITKREYKINTFISVFNVEVEEENKTPAIIAIIIGVVIIVALAIYILNKK